MEELTRQELADATAALGNAEPPNEQDLARAYALREFVNTPAELNEGSWDALQDFVRINTSDSVRTFMAKHPRFVPQSFWYAWLPSSKTLPSDTVLLGVGPLYERRVTSGQSPTGIERRQSLTHQVGTERARQSVTPGRWLWMEIQSLLRAAWRTGFNSAIVAELQRYFIGDDEEYLRRALERLTETGGKSPLAAFQRATELELLVQAMHRSPWRARHCLQCTKPFIADERNKNRKYCSQECFVIVRKGQQDNYEGSGKRPPRRSKRAVERRSSRGQKRTNRV